MKKALVAVMVLGLVVLFGHAVMAQDSGVAAVGKMAGQKPGGFVVQSVSSTATVEAINAKERIVTLKFADGSAKPYKLGPEVRNFDQIKQGDKVKATYLESVALFVRKADDKPFAGDVQTVQVAPKGAKPGIITTNTFEVAAKVTAIDHKKRTVSLKGPEGNVLSYKVDKSVKRFKDVKVGDDLVLRVNQAVAIAVEPAK